MQLDVLYASQLWVTSEPTSSCLLLMFPRPFSSGQTGVVQPALADHKAGRPMPEKEIVTMDELEKIVFRVPLCGLQARI